MKQCDPTLLLGKRKIGRGHATYLIAEIGVNHEGSIAICKKMIKAAADAGADAIKLQTIDAGENYVKGTESYQIFSRCALTQEETQEVFEYATSCGVDAFTTCGDFSTLQWLAELNPPAYKISSGLLTHLPLIEMTARLNKPLLISTGMAEKADIDQALAVIKTTGNEAVGLFQCTSRYPAPLDSLDLAAIAALTKKYDVPVGFSDHSLGIEAVGYAVAAGACMIEKHFTLDVERPGYDHRISLMPNDFAAMVKRVHFVESLLGCQEKVLSKEERQAQQRYHRCLVARTVISRGALLSEGNIAVKRPFPENRGLPPVDYQFVLGKRAMRDLQPDDPITMEVLEEGEK